MWTNGEKLTYTFWAPNEPNHDHGLAHYVHMYETGHWNDDTNHRKFFAVAEEDPSLSNTGRVTPWLWLLALAPAVALLVIVRRALSRPR